MKTILALVLALALAALTGCGADSNAPAASGPSLATSQALVDETNRVVNQLPEGEAFDGDPIVAAGMADDVKGLRAELERALRGSPDAHACVKEGVRKRVALMATMENMLTAAAEGRMLDALALAQALRDPEKAKQIRAASAACKAKVGYKGEDDR